MFCSGWWLRNERGVLQSSSVESRDLRQANRRRMSKIGAAIGPPHPEHRAPELSVERGKGWQQLPYFRRVIQLDNSTPEPDRDRVSPVIRAKLRKYISDVSLDGRFAE